MSNQTVGTEALEGLMARSATDADFRRRLLDQPRAAVAEYTGREVPESLQFKFVENKADATFVLPEAVSVDGELNESELEAVAGGSWVGIAIAVFCAFVAGASSPDGE